MKTLHLMMIGTVLTIFVAANVNAQQQAGRSIGWGISDPSGGPILEEHEPGSTIHFQVFNNFGLEKGLVLMKVIGSTDDLSGNDVLYQEAEELVNAKAQFSYTVPANATNMPVRYWAKFYSLDTNSSCCSVDFVVPKYDNAIVISDLNITDNSAIPNEFDFRFKVTDSRGAEITPINVNVSTSYEQNGVSNPVLANILLKDYYPYESVEGKVTLPNGTQYGRHVLLINASNTSNAGFKPLEAKISFDLIGNNVQLIYAMVDGKEVPVMPPNFKPKTITENMTLVPHPMQVLGQPQGQDDFLILLVGITIAVGGVMFFVLRKYGK